MTLWRYRLFRDGTHPWGFKTVLTSSLHRAFLAAALAFSLGGCLKTMGSDITGSLPTPPANADENYWRRESENWAPRYERNPGDRNAALGYGRALRALGQRPQALAVLEQAALRHPNDLDILGAYGRALSDSGRLAEAADILSRAHSPDRPDWRILSAQGVVSDKMGEHDKAQRFYGMALKIKPNEPTIMSNLGFSYALTKRLGEAEAILRQATAQPGADMRVRQNLVLVLGLQGRFGEAESIARQDLSPAEAQNNIVYLKRFLSQPNTWEQLKNGARPGQQQSAARSGKPRSAAQLEAGTQ